MKAQEFPLLPIRFGDIDPHPRNAEIYTQKHEDGDLAGSIGEFGVLHDPIVSRQQNGRFVILSGHRRIEAALCSGKMPDDTIICRVMTGISDWEERAILIHANKQREKTQKELLAERHELIAIGRELGVQRASRKMSFSDHIPRNIAEAARMVGLKVQMAKNISSTLEKIKLCSDPDVQKEAQEAFDVGKYGAALSVIKSYWNDTTIDRHARLTKVRRDVQIVERGRIVSQKEVVKALKLEVNMLKERIEKLKAENAELKKRLEQN